MGAFFLLQEKHTESQTPPLCFAYQSIVWESSKLFMDKIQNYLKVYIKRNKMILENHFIDCIQYTV